jgi:sulfur-oxidizing protein SoxY
MTCRQGQWGKLVGVTNVIRLACLGLILAGGVSITPTSAEELSWAKLKPSVYGDRQIIVSDHIVKLDTPYRAKDDRQVPITVTAQLPDGRSIRSVNIIIDENPMPVSLTVHPQTQRSYLWVSANMRFNGPSPIRAVIEADDGKLYMSEKMVKTSGLGACASPPVTGMDEAIVTLGNMSLQLEGLVHSAALARQHKRRARLDISHPNLTGLQMDQITLQYILPRYVSKIDVALGKDKLLSMEAGISMSENPSIAFEYTDNGASQMSVQIEDTDESVFRKSFQINLGS